MSLFDFEKLLTTKYENLSTHMKTLQNDLCNWAEQNQNIYNTVLLK